MGSIRDEREVDRVSTPGWDISHAPIIGHFARDPQEGAAINAIKQAGVETQAYRAPQQQGYQNVLANQMQMYQPYNEAMGRIYGAGAQQNLNPESFAPPVTPEALAVGSEQATPGEAAPGGRVNLLEPEPHQGDQRGRNVGTGAGFLGGGMTGALLGRFLGDRFGGRDRG